jgi:hypothetical protein
MQEAALAGFNPYATAGIDTGISIRIYRNCGITDAAAHSWWVGKVLADSTDWGLCAACDVAFRTAIEERRRARREADERHASVQAIRRSAGRCTMCGQKLNVFLKLLRRDRHGGCLWFEE